MQALSSIRGGCQIPGHISNGAVVASPYLQVGCFQLKDDCDENWENNPDSCKSTSGYLLRLAESYKVARVTTQDLTAQSSMQTKTAAMAYA